MKIKEKPTSTFITGKEYIMSPGEFYLFFVRFGLWKKNLCEAAFGALNKTDLIDSIKEIVFRIPKDKLDTTTISFNMEIGGCEYRLFYIKIGGHCPRIHVQKFASDLWLTAPRGAVRENYFLVSGNVLYVRVNKNIEDGIIDILDSGIPPERRTKR